MTVMERKPLPYMMNLHVRITKHSYFGFPFFFNENHSKISGGGVVLLKCLRYHFELLANLLPCEKLTNLQLLYLAQFQHWRNWQTVILKSTRTLLCGRNVLVFTNGMRFTLRIRQEFVRLTTVAMFHSLGILKLDLGNCYEKSLYPKASTPCVPLSSFATNM